MVFFVELTQALQLITQIQSLWETNNIHSYVYGLQLQSSDGTSFCDELPRYITVTNDIVTDTQIIFNNADQLNCNPFFFGRFTIDDLFQFAILVSQSAFGPNNCTSDPPCNVQFEYDPTYYYPTVIRQNYSNFITFLEISCFTSLTDGFDTSNFPNKCNITNTPTPTPTDVPTKVPSISVCNKECSVATQGKPCIHITNGDNTCFDYGSGNICPSGTVDCSGNSNNPCDICINQGNPCKHDNDNTCYSLPQNGICYPGTTLCSGNPAKMEQTLSIIQYEPDISKEMVRLTLVLSGIIAVIIVIVCMISITILMHKYYYSYKQPKFISIKTNDSDVTTDAMHSSL